MIVSLLDGGIGNQLFQYAAGRRLAHKLNTKFKMDLSKCEAEKSLHHGAYKLGYFNIKENFSTANDLKNINTKKGLRLVKEDPAAKIPGVFIPEVLKLPDNIFLSGWWQSEKYFSDIEKIIRREFTLKNPLHENSAQWRKKILSVENSVSLHIRHGDYLTPMWRNHTGILPMDYYVTCVNEFKRFLPNFTLFVFSDDLDWAEKNLNFGVPIEFVKNCELDVEELYLMSLCKHNITANSSFSWWGAWLNQNPNKKIFSPYPWHKRGWGGDTIIPESWNKVQVDFNKNPHLELPPTLSIIFYAENNSADLQTAVSSIVAQQDKNFELMIVDATADGSENFLRQLAVHENVNFLKVSRSIGKYAAWNKAIDCVRGEYVLFLNGNDFIMSETTILLNHILYGNFQMRVNNPEKYISSESYGANNPNIICSTQKILEDGAGTVTIPALPNKKFLLKTDSQFKDLKNFTEIKISGAQKLSALASGQINNFISTKFFKREFLNQNNIRFDEKLSADSELFFLANAFIHSENIFVMPQIFGGSLK